MDTRHPVVLFDGVCNLCNGAVHWLVDHDADGELRFASIQSRAADRLFFQRGIPPAAGDPESMTLFDTDGGVYDRSTAALRIAGHLPFPWSVGRALLWVPRGIRDAVYGVIAKNRYRWFGKQHECRVPTTELRARFLAEPE